MLEALDAALGVGRRGFGFNERDVSVDVDPETGFSLLLTLVPSAGSSEFTQSEIETFGMHIDVSDAAAQRLFVRVTGRTEADGVFRTRMSFEKSDGLDDGVVSRRERESLAFVVLPAVREARREFYERGGLWWKFGSIASASDKESGDLASLGEQYGTEVVDQVLGETTRTALTDAVAGAISGILFADQYVPGVKFSLFGADPGEALRDVELRITEPNGPAARRVSEHSVGTQSVAVVGLFAAYLAHVAERTLALGLEEPEAHLHPQATRAIVGRVLAGQLPTIITTHSTAVTDGADPRDIVVLRRGPAGTRVGSVPDGLLGEAEAADIRRRIAEAGSEFLFARVVLLAEGPSERLALPVFCRQLGWDLDVLGAAIAAVGGGSFRPFLKLLGDDALAIPHYVVCDNDAAPTLVSHLADLGRLPANVDVTDLPGSRDTMAAVGYWYWSSGTLEDVIIASTGTQYIVSAIDDIWPGRLDQLAASWGAGRRDEAAFVVRALRKLSKPQVMRRTAELMALAAEPVPRDVEDLLRVVVARAQSEAAVAGKDS